jgi:hypothetical protein
MSSTPFPKQRACSGLAVLLLLARVYTDSLGKWKEVTMALAGPPNEMKLACQEAVTI